MEFSIGLDSPFNLEYTLESGQVFRWENRGEWWYGILREGMVKVRQDGPSLACSSSSDALDASCIRRYFRLDEDLRTVLGGMEHDPTLAAAVQRFYGMRLVRQDFWECLASFILATNSNIPRIRSMVAAVSGRFGRPADFEGVAFRSFPDAETLAGASVADLMGCGLGYRAPYLRKVAAAVSGGAVDHDQLSFMEYEAAHSALLRVLRGEKLLLGVGPKVADCVLLYSCGKDEAFPIDVWIARELARSFPGLVSRAIGRKLEAARPRLSRGEYAALSAAARARFGRYAGYAQQYLFMLSRERGPVA